MAILAVPAMATTAPQPVEAAPTSYELAAARTLPKLGTRGSTLGANLPAGTAVNDRDELSALRRDQAAAQRAAAEEKARQEAAAAERARQEAAARDAANRSTRSYSRTDPPPSNRGGVAAVLAFARNQIGKPYVYGAAGPNSWDCSGLTQKAYAEAGVRLEHYDKAQARQGRYVSPSQMQPGDLVVMDGHVGIYTGNGMMIHAPKPGDHVKESKIWTSNYSGRRLIG